MEKRKLSQYELILLASAYNLKNYCDTTSCNDCIFEYGPQCILTGHNNPYDWELDIVQKKDDLE